MARILVVDDDVDIVKLVVRRLQHANHRVHGVHNGAEALAFVEAKGTPDVVILDVDMPNTGGLELLGQLRASSGEPELPAIFLSGRMRPEDIAAGRELGAVYLTKPFVANALIGAIDAIIAAKQRKEAPAEDW